MSFRGRTVFALILLTVVATTLVNLMFSEGMERLGLSGNEVSSRQLQENDRYASASKQPTAGTHDKVVSLDKLETVYSLLRERFYREMDEQELIDGAIKGMLDTLEDPHSAYMNAEQAAQFKESILSATYSGIGAEVSLHEGRVQVVSPIKGSPAEKAGIRAKDIILAVNGESLDGLTLNEAVMKIRGPKGTKAKLQILRGEAVEPVEIIVVRDDIDIEMIHAEMKENQIGYIEISQFINHTTERFAEEVAELEKQGMKGLIIDVRNNPGGLLPEVVELSKMLVPSGQTIVQVEDRTGRVEKTVSNGEAKPYPIVVLINKGSASASEILAGALQDNKLAYVIGESSYGKGTVQSTFESGMEDGSNIKLTIAKWLTPAGTFVDGEGVKPDVEVHLPELYYAAPLSKQGVLQLDQNTNEIANLQLMLNGLGYATDRQDGYFSVQTESAVKTFQRIEGLDTTGKVDEKTALLLEQRVVEELLKPENDTQMTKAMDHLLQMSK